MEDIATSKDNKLLILGGIIEEVTKTTESPMGMTIIEEIITITGTETITETTTTIITEEEIPTIITKMLTMEEEMIFYQIKQFVEDK